MIRGAFQDRAGLSAVEFALVAPLIVLVFGGVLELIRFESVGAAVASAAGEAARVAAMAPDGAGATRTAIIREVVTRAVCPRALGEDGGCMWDEDGTPLTVTPTVQAHADNVGRGEPYVDQAPGNGAYDVGEPYTDFNGNGRRDSDMSGSGGGAGDLVVYEIAVAQKFYLPFVTATLGERYMHRAQVALRNAPK